MVALKYFTLTNLYSTNDKNCGNVYAKQIGRTLLKLFNLQGEKDYSELEIS